MYTLTVRTMQDDVLLAYQLCFDLFENESQAFNFKVKPLVDLAYEVITSTCHGK